MIKLNWFLLFFGFLLLFFSCDILRNSPYVVEAWTPGEGFHNDPGRLRVSILFSNASDKAKTEQAFSLTENGTALKGYFFWEGFRLTFIPAAPLIHDRDYKITVGTEAQDISGVSLEHIFEVSFTTRLSGEKPRIIRTEPEHGGSFSGNREEFRLFFSEPVRLNSCLDFISFSPATPGSWRLEDEGRTACFIPRDPWQAENIYQLRVASAFSGVSGSMLGTEYSSVFYASDDREKPVLLGAIAIFPESGEEEIPINSYADFSVAAEYSSWERSTRLCFVFSRPVDLSNLRSLIVIEPALNLVMESAPGMSNRAVFRFAEYPEWGSSFLFRLRPGVKDLAGNESEEEYFFRIRAAGPLSKPPALAGMRLPLSPGNSRDQEALSFSTGDLFSDLPIKDGEDRYPVTKQTPAWIELYFETAAGTEIDHFSLMDLFRVESTNNALSFSPRSLKTSDFTITDPVEGWEDLHRIEIRGILVNSVNSGVVTFRIPPGLRDKRGNRSALDFRISFLK